MTEPRMSADNPEAGGGVFRPIVFGEALFDHFPDGSRVLGGAPFNVAWHLRGFKVDPLLITAVGLDKEGVEILERMDSWGLDTSGVQVHPTRPTGRVTAYLQEDQPRFEIEPNQAYDGISVDALPPMPEPSSARLLYHGSLCLREATSADTLSVLKENQDAPVLVDVNLRDPWWNRESTREHIRGAQWLKVNEDEAGLLSDRSVSTSRDVLESAQWLRDELSIPNVVVTLGAAGAMAVTDAEPIFVGAREIKDTVDTVGAGDAFSAVLALGIHGDWPMGILLERASEFAGELCRTRGATSADPELYSRVLRRWNLAS